MRSNASDNIQLSEICSSTSSDSDSDGIPDDCDCEPDIAFDHEVEITGLTEICGDEVVEYSAHFNGLVINEVEFNTLDILELKNYGPDPIDITGYFIDAGTNSSLVGPTETWKTLTGDYIVDPDEIVQLMGDFISPDSEIAIYKSNINNDATNMVSYVKFGNPTEIDNLLNAIIAGLWSGLEDGIDVSTIGPGDSKSIEYDGHGNQSSDWKVNDSSLGNENEFRSSFVWEFTGSDELEFGNDQYISLDFEDAVSGDLIFYLLEGTNCIQSRTSISITVNENLLWYIDSDLDGFGNPATAPIDDCDNPSGAFTYVNNDGDCDDTNPNIHEEREWFLDADQDGLGDPNELTKIVACNDPSDELSYVTNNQDPDDTTDDLDEDGIKDGDEINIHNTDPSSSDTDSDGLEDGDELSFGTDPNEPDSDSDGCSDGEEVLNVTDPNDPNSGAGSFWYMDFDSDGFGDPNMTKLTCTQPTGYVSNSQDCNDNDNNVFPGAPTRADGKDNDCDGVIDKLGQIITFEPLEDFILNDDIITLSAFSSSELPVSFEVTGPAIVSFNSMVFKGAGRVTIAARQNGNNEYLPAEEVVHTFCVNPRRPIIKQTDNELRSNNLSGNLWFKDGQLIPGETGNTIIISGDGSYTTQTIVDGCESEISETFIAGMTEVTGLRDGLKRSVKVYPNPVSNYLNFELDDIHDEVSIELIDFSGQQYAVYQFDLFSGVEKILLTEYMSGVYFYKISTKSGVVTGKFLKK